MARKGQKPPRLNLRPQQPRRMNTTDDDSAAAVVSAANSTRAKRSRASLRRYNSTRSDDYDSQTYPSIRPIVDETSSLLSQEDGGFQNYTSMYKSSRPRTSRNQSGYVTPKHRSKPSSWNLKLSSTIASGWAENDVRPIAHKEDLKASQYSDERVWYDQYTSTDWVHDNIADNLRVQDLRNRKDIRGRLLAWFDGGQGWILAALVGCITACIAYFVNITESAIFDIKEGYCTSGIYISKSNCCLNQEDCPLWKSWGQAFSASGPSREMVDFFFYVVSVSVFASAASLLTLTTKTTVPSPLHLPMMDENLAADLSRPHREDYDREERTPHTTDSALPLGSIANQPPMTVYYPAAGSGVAEVKVILSGFVVHGYMGFKTLIVKTMALILAIASGLSLGKEGPFVHIATCVGNICCRLFYKYNHNDGKRREILSASAAGGVAVAFGAPIGGVLFSLEEVSYYFPPKTLFRTFFCCIAAALSLKFLNPYGTGKIVLFQVVYDSDWQLFELVVFIVIGMLGGALGALFIKASHWWAWTFRKIPAIKEHPVVEVLLVAMITAFMQFWNSYTRRSVATLLLELASPCSSNNTFGLCPKDADEIKDVLGVLLMAFLIKGFLTTITFGIKVPGGIYVPSMVVGGLMGRISGHIVQWFVLSYPHIALFSSCPVKNGGPESCVTPGVYALVAAGATMCGVTRLSVTLVIILFELTGSLDHVLPFSLAVLVAKWTADALEPRSIYVGYPDNWHFLLANVIPGHVNRNEFLPISGQQNTARLYW